MGDYFDTAAGSRALSDVQDQLDNLSSGNDATGVEGLEAVAQPSTPRSEQSDLSDSGGEEDSGTGTDTDGCNHDDFGEEGGEEEREYTGCFEGPEKTLEVYFKPGVGDARGCRALTRPQLDQICKRAKCTIMSKMSNAKLDAYVLSESSLFVYSHKLLIKTCGTTTLLRCIAVLVQHACKGLGMELEWVGYSRKNFTFPTDQLFPHSGFEQEIGYLRSHSHLSQRLNGSGYVLGPVTGDHWFVYVADKCTRPSMCATDRTINIMMFDMHPDCAQHFYKDNVPGGAKEMTASSGIAALVPGAQIDDCAFDPCGYSMNAIQYGSYYTVHVTPEESCSYASFETNNPFKSYRSIIKNVLNVFRPRRFVMTMIADQGGLKEMTECPFEAKEYGVARFGSYVRTSQSSTKVDGDCCVIMGNWDLRVDRPVLGRQRSHTEV